MRPVRKEDRTASESFWSAMLHAERSRQRWLWHGNLMPEVGLVWKAARLVFMTLTRPVRPIAARWRRRQALRRRLKGIL